MTPSDPEVIRFTVGSDNAGTRLDALVSLFAPDCSRACAGKLIRDGMVAVNGSVKKPGYRTAAGDMIAVTQPASNHDSAAQCRPEPLDVEVLYSDSELIVINKPPGLVVHPAAGNPSGTLVNGLLHHFPEIERVGSDPARPGIVHRLDKDTSGVLLIARSQRAYESLTAQFKQRSVQKSYIAFVNGRPDEDTGTITLPIHRHPVHRKKMTAAKDNSGHGRYAETSWRVCSDFDREVSMVECCIKTGRTHQIRVHLAAIGHPVVGDPVYGYKRPLRPYQHKPLLAGLIRRAGRQMLHARRIEIRHPATGDLICFEAPLATDMADFLSALNDLHTVATDQ